ncbi:hypothetical protein TL16_g01972 [Triparma laevis f. inornata]|uniref:Uncharacterized protein n=1 Tax=Triparma laevis f. inornata TaxID=1714386 RepID=A0A9W7DVH0_9STRA|nr:hypothetical protein TL16_g01972 [Triparma laevis f. inornata]
MSRVGAMSVDSTGLADATSAINAMTLQEETLTSVWVKDNVEVWKLQDVESTNEEGLPTILDKGGKAVTLDLQEFHPHDPTHSLDLDDISRLNNLHEAPLLHVLKRRFNDDKIYTWVGHVLLSVNPYRVFPGMYNLEEAVAEANSSAKELKELTSDFDYPHVYSIARVAHNHMASEKKHALGAPETQNQSIVVSGESGAGKTEASKHVMRYLLASSANTDKEVGEQIQSSFGKYIKLKYDKKDTVVGAKTDHFLLEKSRLIHVEDGERNYHAFYQMCAGLDPAVKEELKLKTADAYLILSQGNMLTVSAEVDDAKEFQKTAAALGVLGVDEATQSQIWKMLTGLLFLGNAKAAHPDDDEYRQVEISFDDPDISLEKVAELFGVNSTVLKNACCIRMQTSGRGSTTAIPLNPTQAMNNIFALVKYTYGSLFKVLVNKINDAHRTAETTKVASYIGILDIFGFEIMQVNSFEQLCINFANEMLQRQFNQQVFVLEKQRYEEEGLKVASIAFQDNQPVIDLVSKKPEGLFFILEEHGMMNRKPDNKALLSTFHQRHEKHTNYGKTRFGGGDEFIVKHFAGDVTYNINNFIEKNNDSLNEQLLAIMSNSELDFVKEVFTIEAVEAAGAGKKDVFDLPNPPERQSVSRARQGTRVSAFAQKQTVSSKFRAQLERLVEQLQATTPHYIKCVKPNAVKLPGGFSNKMVVEQLRYSGVLEVVRIRRQGYPVRLRFLKFVKQFEVLLSGSPCAMTEEEDYKDEKLLQIACAFIGEGYLEEDHYQIGRTKIFLRDGVLEECKAAVKEFYNDTAAKIQALFRCKIEMRKYADTKEKLLALQGFSRMMVAKKQYRRKQAKMLKMQQMIRGKLGRKQFQVHKAKILLERKRNDNAKMIQAVMRGKKCRSDMKNMKSTIILQKQGRMFVEKRKFEKKKEANIVLQNKLRQMSAKKELGLRKFRKKENDSATKIAAKGRAMMGTGKFLKKKKAAIALQCAARSTKARSIMFSEKTRARLDKEAKERKAAARIQGGFRMVKAKERVQEMREERNFVNAVTAIQCKLRVLRAMQRIGKRRTKRNNECARILQTRARERTCRKEFLKKKEAMVKIQGVARGKIEKKNFAEAKKGAKVLQARARERSARKEFEKTKEGILRVQTMTRGRAEKRKFETDLARVRGLQRAVKAFLAGVRLQEVVMKAHKFAKNGKLDDLIDLLDRGRSQFGDLRIVRNKYEYNYSMLHSAAICNSTAMVGLLCSEKEDVFQIDNDGNSPFHIGAKHSSFKAMKYFTDTALNGVYKDNEEEGEDGLVAPRIVDLRHLSTSSTNSFDRSIYIPEGGSKWNDLPIIIDGFLKKRKEWRGWDKRWVVLRKDRIQYFKRRGDSIPIREISMKQCMIKKSGEKNCFELHSPLLLDKGNKQGRMYFAAESEQELQKWLLALRRCDGQTQELRHKRTSARSYLDLDKRGELCALRNKRGETALHLVCENATQGTLSIEIALWLAEFTAQKGKGWLNHLNCDGNSALHFAVQAGHIDIAAALVRKGADMNLKNVQGKTALDLIDNSADIEKVCMVGNVGGAGRMKLLEPPSKVKGLTYLTMLAEKITLQGARELECPHIRVSVYNKNRELVEEPQDINKFCHRNDTCLWYTTQVHMQTPLENTDESFLLIELLDENLKGKKINTQCLSWTFLRLTDGTIDSANHNLECFQPPVKLHLGENIKRASEELVPAVNGAFLTVDTYLTTRQSSRRKNH